MGGLLQGIEGVGFISRPLVSVIEPDVSIGKGEIG